MEYPEKEPVFSISTAAKLLNISVHTIRMYEREGLILPFKNEAGQRLFSMKDVERIEVIRKSINEFKISIAGIKSMLSMIPCWKIKNCSETKDTCDAFNSHTTPCWNIKHKSNHCSKMECRECDVYMNYADCNIVKFKLIDLFMN